MRRRRTKRWAVAPIAVLITSAVGVLFGNSTAVLLGIPAVAFAAYSHLTAPPQLSLALERSIETDDPRPDEAVEISVTLRNMGKQTVTDLRVIDGIPKLLPVRNGSARHIAVLGPGKQTTFSYTVTGKSGVHQFEPATVVAYNQSKSLRTTTTITTETELDCRGPNQTPVANWVTRQFPGSVRTADSGSGTEFSKLRPYRPGDPVSRIDWKRYARSGELATISFHEDYSRTLTLCLDARNQCYRSCGDDEPHAVLSERSAARTLLESMSASNERIGLAVLTTDCTWVAPNTGAAHTEMIQRTLDDPATLPLDPPTDRTTQMSVEQQLQKLRQHLDRGTGVIFLSPLLDEPALEVPLTLEANGHPVTVISPDVTARGSTGTALASRRRDLRIQVLRQAGVSIVDWLPKRPLATILQRRGAR
ncbi:DUF58 domain-containing protein [Haloarcula amylovorans]|uniref:DUF58 domain-containing protein n=1 Tax=Haloarcula amylovorans TaxID=2562280 RepID=UPI001076063E